ncbi:MAG: hypothetical protein ACM3NQ_13670 [Bacteroidales bacterium]
MTLAVAVTFWALGSLGRLVVVAATSTSPPMPQAAAPAGLLKVPVVVLDAHQKPVTNLQPGDFAVRADGAPREVVSVERSDQGARTFLILIDRDTLSGADGRSAVQVAGTIIDGLPAQDGVELVTLPATNLRVTPTLDRTALRAALSQVNGRLDQVKAVGWNVLIDALGGDSILAREARSRAAELLTSVSRYLDDLRGRPGHVIVVLLSNRIVTGNWNEVEVQRTAAVAAAFGAPIYVLPLYGEAWTHAGGAATGMRVLAELTGGAVIPVVKDSAGAARRVLQEAAALYVVGVPRSASDTGDHPAQLKVAVSLAGATVRSPSRLMMPLEKGAVISPFLAQSHINWSTVTIRPRDLRLVREAGTDRGKSLANDHPAMSALTRAGELIEQNLRDVRVMAADERYEEHVKRELPSRDVPFSDRVLLGQLFLANAPSVDETWIAFRDVASVDGVAVTDWDHGLDAAFSGPIDAAVKTAAAIDQQGLRFHIGTLKRRTVSPMLPLLFLQARHRERFRFDPRGQDKIEGVTVQRIDYVEQAQPTLARAIRNNNWSDVRTQGTFWIDGATGRVLKATVVWDEGMFLKTELTATYAATAVAGITPVTLREVYSTLSATGLLIEATARYSNWRAVGSMK